jgi:drug/metabolite transporter (DMT)-like permease
VAGLLDSGAMVAFLLALRAGPMSLVAVVTALYPAFTVALATVVDGERMLRTQAAGIALAAGAIVMISWTA